MAADVAGEAGTHSFAKAAPTLTAMPYLALTSNDGLAGDTNGLVKAITADGGAMVTTAHEATDHGWSDHRIALEARVIEWLESAPHAEGR